MVLMPNCGKIALGMLIAAAKTNLPAIFDCGHLVLTGLNPEVSERTASERTDFRPGEDERVVRIGAQFRPDCQSCWGWREAHAVKVLIEALGMALPDSSAGPPGLASRFRRAKRAGRNIVELWRQGISTSDILTPDAFRNGLTAGLALGCAPKTLQYLMAMAEEAGVRLEAHVMDQLSTGTRQASS
jgi:dihydroxy-acid dehydratase